MAASSPSLWWTAVRAVLPVTLAGMVHVALLRRNSLSAWALPLDGGHTWRGRPIFGANKTWRGPLTMAIATLLSVHVQTQLLRRRRRDTRPWTGGHPWMAGAAVGLAYSLGELPNSFLKRRWGLPPGGQARLPWSVVQWLADWVDSVAACALMLLLLRRIDRHIAWRAAILGTAVHAALDLGLYRLGIKGGGIGEGGE